MTGRTATRLAWTLWAVSVAGAVGFVVLELTRGQVPPSTAKDAWFNAQEALGAVAFPTVGAIVLSRRKDNILAWLFMALGVTFAISCVGGALVDTFTFRSSTWQWGTWLDTWSWVPGWFFLLTYFLLLFPDGHLPSRRWRWVGWGTAVSIAGVMVSGMFDPTAGGTAGFTSPLPTLPQAVANGGQIIFSLAAVVAAMASIVALVLRYRRSTGDGREQMKWFVYAGVATILLAPARTVAAAPTPVLLGLGLVSIPILPIAVGIAISRYRLYDIDVVINKTVVYALLAAFITAVYVGIVVGIGQTVGSKRNLGLSILATAVVAVGFQPVRDRVQHLANRLVYGKRATPYEVLSEFSERMSGTYAADDLLPRMARILGEGTGAASASVWLRVGQELRPEASWPVDARPTAHLVMADGQLPALEGADRLLPVSHHGELLGALSITKARGDALRPAEEKLAEDLASQAGLVLRNVRLTEELLERLKELQASRQRIVAAQDEERRKLERNLHDGAQQQLVALQVRLSLAERLAEEDCRVKDQLASLKQEAGEALENLRDLARGIYPPLLADQGLAAALTSQARKATFPVSIEADGISRYPQDQEAAVYFCVLEALQNVAKYAGASRAFVRLSLEEGRLRFQIEDDGVGFDLSATRYGTGLQGMADRLEALGGELAVRSAPGSGTTVSGEVRVGHRHG